jgi:hypothetical protein
MATQGTKPYMKLASGLVLIGMALFSLERLGLGRLEGANSGFHLNQTVLTVLVVAPVALVAAGAVVFVVGKIRRL